MDGNATLEVREVPYHIPWYAFASKVASLIMLIAALAYVFVARFYADGMTTPDSVYVITLLISSATLGNAVK